MIAASAIAGSAALPSGFAQTSEHAPAKPVSLNTTINGEERQLQIDPRTTLLDLLREDLHLTGTKKGCDRGQCGACTVLADGRRINSCLTLAITCNGKKITTVEGLAKDGELSPVQQAFLDNDGYQCGYCTPGQIISAVALLEEAQQGAVSFVTEDLSAHPGTLSDVEIRERMSGNLCRCGAYPGIVAAVRQAMSHSAPNAATLLHGETNAAV